MISKLLRPLSFLGLVALITAGCASSSNTTDRSQRPSSPRSSNGDGIKAFSEVIKNTDNSDEGLFTIHRDDDKIFYEIPIPSSAVKCFWSAG